jgi:ABC-type molybdenum transport system ATPase subunit/photorepair protein PhrA
VGLYRHPASGQIETARRVLATLGLSALSSIPFDQLSQGQRQLVLITPGHGKTSAPADSG